MVEPTLSEIAYAIARAPDSTGSSGCERLCKEGACFCAEIYEYAALAVQALYRSKQE